MVGDWGVVVYVGRAIVIGRRAHVSAGNRLVLGKREGRAKCENQGRQSDQAVFRSLHDSLRSHIYDARGGGVDS